MRKEGVVMAAFYGALYFAQSIPTLAVALFHTALGWILADRFRFDVILSVIGVAAWVFIFWVIS